MILTLFIVMMSLSMIVVLMGYFTGDEPYLPVGLFFLSLLGLAILNGQVQLVTGETTNTSFSYTNGTLTGQAETTTITYATWNDTTSHWIGYTLTVLSICGIGLSLFHLKNRRAEEDG